MKTIEARKRWAFVCTLAVIAIVINTTCRPSRPTPQENSFHQPGVARPIPGINTPEELAAEHARYQAKYLNAHVARRPGTKAVAVVVVSEDGRFNPALAAAIAKHLDNGSVELLTSCFQSAFVTDGLFTNALAGSREPLDKLELAKAVDALLLGRQEVRYSSDPSLENLITANMQLEIHVISTATGDAQSWTFVANGAGFKETEARLIAQDRLIKQIAKDTNMSLGL